MSNKTKGAEIKNQMKEEVSKGIELIDSIDDILIDKILTPIEIETNVEEKKKSNLGKTTKKNKVKKTNDVKHYKRDEDEKKKEKKTIKKIELIDKDKIEQEKNVRPRKTIKKKGKSKKKVIKKTYIIKEKEELKIETSPKKTSKIDEKKEIKKAVIINDNETDEIKIEISPKKDNKNEKKKDNKKVVIIKDGEIKEKEPQIDIEPKKLSKKERDRKEKISKKNKKLIKKREKQEMKDNEREIIETDDSEERIQVSEKPKSKKELRKEIKRIPTNVKKREEKKVELTIDSEKNDEIKKEKKEIREDIKTKTKELKTGIFRRKILVILIIFSLLFVVIAGFFYENNEELLTVQIPTEKIGDKATYDVKANIKTTDSRGIQTQWGDIESLDISFTGDLVIQTNETTKKEDGFGEEHDVLDRYIDQDLVVDGSIKISIGLKVTLEPKGDIITKESAFIDLKEKTTIQRKISNEIDINAGVGDIILKDDIRFYTPPKNYLSYTPDFLDITNIIPEDRTIKEGDDHSNSEGNNSFRWKAEGVDTIYGKKALRINITVENFLTRHEFSSMNTLVWIANDISLPVKFLVKGNIDLTELSQSPIDFRYEATMKDYIRGDKIIPYRDCDGKHFHKKRPGYDNEYFSSKDWEYVPPRGNMASSLPQNFTGDNASEFAYNNISNYPSLEEYMDWNNKYNPYVIEAYYNETINKKWNLSFAYKDNNPQDMYVEGYNALVTKTLNNTTAEGEKLKSKREPLIEKKDIKDCLSFSAAEQIFKSDEEINRKTFLNEKLDFKKVNFGIKVNEIPSTNIVGFNFNPFESFELLGGYNYYMEKSVESYDQINFFRTTIDGQNGQMLYVISHSYNSEFLSLIS